MGTERMPNLPTFVVALFSGITNYSSRFIEFKLDITLNHLLLSPPNCSQESLTQNREDAVVSRD
jgi:hypothetical protein